MSNLINFTKRFSESLSQEVKLSNYSWFNLGGNAEFFFKPKDKKELLEFFNNLEDDNLGEIINEFEDEYEEEDLKIFRLYHYCKTAF